jgi:hypothetical protein
MADGPSRLRSRPLRETVDHLAALQLDDAALPPPDASATPTSAVAREYVPELTVPP